MARRGSGCLIIVLVLLLILCGVGVIADRALASTVESRLATAVASNLKSQGTPAATTKVETSGFPFFTQLISGDFKGGKVHLTGLTTPQGKIDRVDLTLHDVKVPRDVLRGAQPHDVTAARVEGSGRLTVATVADRLDLPGLKLQSGGAKTLKASFPITAPIIGSVPVTADVTPKLAKDTLTFDVGNVTAAGVTIPQSVIDSITTSFARPVALNLPFAVSLDRVTAGGGYLTVNGTATNVDLVK
jgi:hypothetical protein